jgi:small conductance mechanosensitive channel
LKRVDELVAIVRATPPAHERPAPWDVPLSEFELELQPLSTEQVLERLDAWRRLLQAEVSKRIQIDILLNDTDKLERSVEVRNEGARLVGVASDEVTLDELKVALAERAEAQQQIITKIVDRMRVAIELSKRRGEDAQQYIDYIASSTGRKLNFSDLSVLRVQLMQWLTSSSGGLLIARNALLFIGIVALFWLISRAAGLITRSAVRRIPKASSLLGPVVAGIVQKVLIVVGFVFAASAVGVDTGPLLAMIGAAGLVIGLALQGTLSNFASGILILLNRPFDVGDVVDAGGVFGKVSAMNLVSTTILTFDNQLMLVPNNQIWNAVITNVTGKRTRRVDLTFGIAYSANIAKAVEVLEEVLGAHPKTLDDPAPIVRVHELGDSSVNLIARPWVRTNDYWDVYWDLMRQVKERFDREGIGIPFPQRDLHVPGAIEVRLSGGAPAATGSPSYPASPQVHRPDSDVRESGPPADDGD